LAFGEGHVVLTIQDDGAGFDVTAAYGPEHGHFGVQGMRERVKRLGGTFSLASTPGAGTRIEATVKD
jgi:signal transduction histidine kinase